MNLQRVVECGVRGSALLVIASLLGISVAPEVGAKRGPVPALGGFVDVHMHLDGVQRQETRRSPRQRREQSFGPQTRATAAQQGSRSGDTESAEHLIAMMDEYGVEKAIVMPPPQYPGQPGSYQYTALLDSIQKYPGRLILGAGGGSLNSMIQATKPSEVTEEARTAFRAKVEEIVRAGAHAIGEMTALHTCMNPKHHYIAAPPDHPLFLLLADLAAQSDIPIDLHMEAVLEDMPTPGHLLQACDRNPDVLPATIPAFERLLEHNPKARVVWQHIGWDNTGQMTTPLIRRLLDKHPNLYLAIKAVPDPTRRNRIHNDAFEVLPEWLALIESYPDRIVAGADEFSRPQGMQGGYEKPPFFKITWQTVMSLPAEVRERIGRENARRIYNLK